jgi:hypothetical protein
MPDDQTTEPEASRPSLPRPYGILGPTEGKGLLPWSWATERLERSRGYWLATTRPDGAAHVTVIWGVWLHGRFYFPTIAGSRKAANLAADPRCVVCPERADEAVVVEGVAENVTDAEALRGFAEAYATKYQEEMDTGQFLVYSVRPRVAFATIADAVEYPATATRWRFPDT